MTPEGLERIDRAEEALRALGFDLLRVRDHGDLARIEVEPSQIESVARHRDEIALRFKELGFSFVTLDLIGFRSGSLNEMLPGPKLRRPSD